MKLPLALLLFFGLTLAQSSSRFGIQKSPNPDGSGNALSAAASTSPSDVWAVGYQAANSSYNDGARTLIEHFDGTAWGAVSSPNPNPGNCSFAGFALNGVSATSSTDAWAVGSRNVNASCTALINPLIEHWDGVSWTAVANPVLSPGGNNVLNGVLAFTTTDVYAAGYQNGPRDAVITLVEHWDGSKWSVMRSANANSTGNSLNAITGTSPTDLWTVGDRVAPNKPVLTLTEHFDGNAWTVVPSPSPVQGGDLDQNVLSAAIAMSAGDVTAVGYALDSKDQTNVTLIEHWDGRSWKVVSSPNVSNAAGSTNRLTAVAAISPSNIYAFGYYADASTAGQPQSLVEHFDGAAWSIVAIPTRRRATQLFGAVALPASNQMWSVGAFSPAGYDIEFGFLQIPKTFIAFTGTP